MSFLESSPKHEKRSTYLPPTRCSQSHISNSLRGEAPCQPRDKVIKVPWPNNTDVHRVTPTHVTVRRCSGGCHQDHQSCVASLTRVREVQVILGKCPVSGGKCEKECASVKVEDEVECECGCRRKECGEKAEWMSDTCECECKDSVARTECLESGYVWDSTQCQCGCPAILSCHSGMEFSKETCQCQPQIITQDVQTLERVERSEAPLSIRWENITIVVLGIAIFICLLIIMILLRKINSLKNNIKKRTKLISTDDSKDIYNEKPKAEPEEQRRYSLSAKPIQVLYNSSSDLSTPPQCCGDKFTDSSFCSDSSECGNTSLLRQKNSYPQYQPHTDYQNNKYICTSEISSLLRNDSQ